MRSIDSHAALRTAALVGLTYGYLELAVGCGVAGAFPSAEERLPSLEVVAAVLLFDAGLGALLGLLAQGLPPRTRPARAWTRAAALAAGGLAIAGLMSFLLWKTDVLFTAWGSRRGPLLVAGSVGGLLAACVLGLVVARVPSRLLQERKASAASTLGLLAYLAVWAPAAGAEALASRSLPPLLGSWIGALVPWMLLLAGSWSRKGGGGLSQWAAVAAALAVLLVPAMRSGRPLDLPATGAAGAGSGPPVILIVADTLRADHLPTYGYPRNTAPHLDALARQAHVFERCTSPSSWTVPAHASLFTGRFPRSHGAHLSPERSTERLGLPRELDTLAESLEAAGYRTFGAAANPWLRAGSGFEQGFEVWDDAQRIRPIVPPLVMHAVRGLAEVRGTPDWLDRADQHLTRLRLPYPSFAEMAHSARRWIHQAGDRPFLLFFNAMEPHDPFEPPEPFASAWPGNTTRELPFHHVRERVMRGDWELEPWMRDQLVSQYDGEISSLDQQLGDFFDWLREEGIFDRAWIVITSDHGEHFGEHGLLWHRVSLYDPLVHVPLLVKQPQQTRGERVDGKVQLVDILPTLLEAAGISVPAGVQGASLWHPRDTAFAELYRDRWIVEEHGERFDRDLVSYEEDRWKLIRRSEGSDELYELQVGTASERERLVNRPELTERLALQLDSMLAELPRADTRSGPAPDPEQLERLRDLGYVE